MATAALAVAILLLRVRTPTRVPLDDVGLIGLGWGASPSAPVSVHDGSAVQVPLADSRVIFYWVAEGAPR